jgi:two-component system, OmpR family, response regulator
VKKFEKVKNYSALEVANICGVVNQTAINWIKKKYLKAFTTPGGQYRVYGEELATFMTSRGMKVPPELKEFLQKGTKTVLMIEDDDQFAWQFFDEINSEYPNCSVERALDSFEAGRKLTIENRDLILINSDMKGLDAEKVCETIRADSDGESKSIIVFAGFVDKIKKESLLRAGADVYLKKPFDIGQISIYLE